MTRREFLPIPGTPWPDDEPLWDGHLATLAAAERGDLEYHRDLYPIHQVSNRTVVLIWSGLLNDSPDRPILTAAGRRRLDAGRAALTPPDPEPEDTEPDDIEPTQPTPAPAAEQPPLFHLETS